MIKHLRYEYSYKELRQSLSSLTNMAYYSIQNKADTLFLRILEQLELKKESSFKKIIQRLLSSENSNYNLNELCQLTGYSPTHLERLMKQNYGCSALEIFNKAKLKKICRLLATTNLSLNEVAEKTQFYDSSHLNRFFKKRMGITPRQIPKILYRPALKNTIPLCLKEWCFYRF